MKRRALANYWVEEVKYESKPSAQHFLGKKMIAKKHTRSSATECGNGSCGCSGDCECSGPCDGGCGSGEGD